MLGKNKYLKFRIPMGDVLLRTRKMKGKIEG